MTKYCRLQIQVGWSSGWTLGLKVLVPSLTKYASQLESKYLHFEKIPKAKTPKASDLSHQSLPIANSN